MSQTHVSAEKAGVDQTWAGGRRPIMQLQLVQCRARLGLFCVWGNDFRNDDRLELGAAWESMGHSPLQWAMRA